jgi:hypothetical protein
VTLQYAAEVTANLERAGESIRAAQSLAADEFYSSSRELPGSYQCPAPIVHRQMKK